MASRIRNIGRALSKMMMPNIGAFITWGLITALFNPDGWFPGTPMEKLIEPLMIFTLPMLIAYTGGKNIYGHRGGIIGVMATMGVIIASPNPMFLGAMIMGPLAAYLLKKMDEIIKYRIPLGFEMLISSVSGGVVGLALVAVSFQIISPVLMMMNTVLKLGVDYVISRNLLFLSAVFIEPAKVLFLNNAINHGILTPLGIQEVLQKSQSILFLLETNPGPGIGILLAFLMKGKGIARQTAPGALIIHALGGIHEVYFPYVMMYPPLFLAVVAGGLAGDFCFQLLDAGLTSIASPGSLFVILALTPHGNFISVLIGVLISSTVSFVVASFLLARKVTWESEEAEEEDFFRNYKGNYQIETIVFACDAGMGSSAMGASMLSKMFAARGLDVDIINTSIDHIPQKASVIVTFHSLMGKVKRTSPQALHIGIKDFLDRSYYEKLIDALTEKCQFKEVIMEKTVPNQILMKSNIILNQASVGKEEAIRYAGRLLVQSGYVEEDYIEGMLAREEKFTTYIGNNVAIPHGENAVKDKIIASGIVVVQYPGGVDFGNGNVAKLLIGIAGKGNEHIQILSNVAEAIEEDDLLDKMLNSQDVEDIFEIFSAEEMLDE